ncbi:hypothetical protein SJAV_10060 [Sulfurisphaera javensis]|uniref:Uncharacterized protein n=1 Tax=Sulfurisphaera javensis TaxID=2049879 RepID=A0AAT9GQ88_9CREN
MQINKSLLKRDVERIEIRDLIKDKKINDIDGDWIRITDYFSFNKDTILLLASEYKKKYGSLAPTISLALLIYGLGLDKREEYMNDESDWEYVKNAIGKFPFEEYYDYENRMYDIHIKTLKTLHKYEFLKYSRNDFVHLQTWILATYLAMLEENHCTITPVRENRVLVSLSIKGNKKDIENVEEQIRKRYGVLFDLNVGWFTYS